MTPSTCPLPLIGFCAYSGTGKTTLLRRLLPLLRARGLRVAVVKHAHHAFEMDYPGKDSYELRKAGADCCIVVSRKRLAMVEELRPPAAEPRLADALRIIDPGRFDLVVVEGFKHEPYPKVELHRPALGRPLLHPDDATIVAVASDAPVRLARPLPLLDLNAPEAVRDFVLHRLDGVPQAGAWGSGEAGPHSMIP